MLRHLAPARRRLTVGLGLIAVAVVVVVSAVLIGRWQAAPTPAAQAGPGPVVVLPGYGGGTRSLEPLVTALREQGREVAVFPGVGNNTGDLDEQAARLATYVEDLRERTGASSVDVVGYSAGGVVARLWVRDHGGDAVARRVLTLASPHHGNSVSVLATEAAGCPVACQQLDSDSDLLRRLNAGDETPDGPQWATIRSTEDQVVTPSTSADLVGALRMVVQSYCPAATTSHGQLPASPVVLAALETVLGSDPPSAPDRGRVDCDA
ncbi:MAG: esterase/lipase family protein [Ornithinimicrobium sp.]|uniref:esterase/lipase family protein n=1 Tax=Ornithinimicrobium sp. TaxID=1977084 RepID=UPI003D9B8652